MSSLFVIDGHARSRERIAEFLADEGHSIQEFEDASTALAAIYYGNRVVELVIVAWMCPG